jgi:hypothetical protein
VIWLKALEKNSLEKETKEGKKIAAGYKKLREKREDWIALLKSDRNPFGNPLTLQHLRASNLP